MTRPAAERQAVGRFKESLLLYEYGTQILMACSSGAEGTAGSLELTLWLHATANSAEAIAVYRQEPEAPWKECRREIPAGRMAQFDSMLTALFKLGPAFQVIGNLDTSLGWVQCVLHVRQANRTWTVDLPLRLSGFSGQGSAELAELIEALFDAVGLEHSLKRRLGNLPADV